MFNCLRIEPLLYQNARRNRSRAGRGEGLRVDMGSSKSSKWVLVNDFKIIPKPGVHIEVSTQVEWKGMLNC